MYTCCNTASGDLLPLCPLPGPVPAPLRLLQHEPLRRVSDPADRGVHQAGEAEVLPGGGELHRPRRAGGCGHPAPRQVC